MRLQAVVDQGAWASAFAIVNTALSPLALIAATRRLTWASAVPRPGSQDVSDKTIGSSRLNPSSFSSSCRVSKVGP